MSGNEGSTVDFATLVRARLATLGHGQKGLSQAAQVTDKSPRMDLSGYRPDRLTDRRVAGSILSVSRLDGWTQTVRVMPLVGTSSEPAFHGASRCRSLGTGPSRFIGGTTSLTRRISLMGCADWAGTGTLWAHCHLQRTALDDDEIL